MGSTYRHFAVLREHVLDRVGVLVKALLRWALLRRRGLWRRRPVLVLELRFRPGPRHRLFGPLPARLRLLGLHFDIRLDLVNVDDVDAFTARDKLVKRIAVRVVRSVFGYFINASLASPPPDDTVALANTKLQAS